MADTKLTALAAITSLTTDDLMYAVDDPSVTPASKKITFDNVQKSITIVGGASGVETQGDFEIPSGNSYYIGDASTNGSWRLVIDGDNLSVQKREAGSWVEKGAFTP